jgi:hypothetical protein
VLDKLVWIFLLVLGVWALQEHTNGEAGRIFAGVFPREVEVSVSCSVKRILCSVLACVVAAAALSIAVLGHRSLRFSSTKSRRNAALLKGHKGIRVTYQGSYFGRI